MAEMMYSGPESFCNSFFSLILPLLIVIPVRVYVFFKSGQVDWTADDVSKSY